VSQDKAKSYRTPPPPPGKKKVHRMLNLYRRSSSLEEFRSSKVVENCKKAHSSTISIRRNSGEYDQPSLHWSWVEETP